VTEPEVRSLFERFDDVQVVVGSTALGHPEAAVGDTFCTYAPCDGTEPDTMPFATIVTKSVPGWDEASDLDRPGAFRVNLNVGRTHLPAVGGEVDHAERDRVLPHPQYATQGWVSIVEPGPSTGEELVKLLDIAYGRARARHRARRARETGA
jgi:hypothetical protein